MTRGDTAFLQLQADEIKYRGIFENAIEGIYLSTPDGHYLVVNTALARMYGYEHPDELMSQVSDIQNQIYVDSSFREQFKQQIEQTGFVRCLEYQVRQRDGTIIWISETARAVRDDHGNVQHYEGFIENITERKNAEAERAKLEKQMLHAQKMDAIGTLAGGMAHDFNNVLGAILGYTELALLDSQIKGTSRNNLQMVLKSSQRARDLIKRILTFSRPADALQDPLKLGPVLKEGVSMLNATLPSSITIQANVQAGDNDVVMADPTEMHQVIMNLGTNAAHAMKSSGGQLEYELNSVELDAAAAVELAIPAGSYVQLVARDTGRGMSAEVLERIFEPFYTTKAAGHGTGLGLTLVQKIVNRCHGYIKVQSQEGKGTTFKIYFPRCTGPVAPATVDKTQIARGHAEQILVVDDEIPVLDVMQQQLRKMGYRVTTRADSLEAMKTFLEYTDSFDLVITDHTMPGMQGAELAAEIGAIRPNLPVILMTGLNQPPDLSGAPNAHLRHVLQKPINYVELSHLLRRFLELAPAPAAPAPQNGTLLSPIISA